MKLELLQEVCDSLNIGRVDTKIFITRDEGKVVTVFDGGNADMDSCVEIGVDLRSGEKVVHSIYPKMGAVLENDDKLQLFAKMLSTYAQAGMPEVNPFFDSGLGIYNMGFFARKTEEIIQQSEICNFGVCFFNLKNFSAVNDRLGREMGTAVMKKYINMLQDKLGKESFVCRVGGDNFMTLFRKDKLELIEEHLKGTAVTYDEVLGEQIMVAANSGFYMINDDNIKLTDILDRASAALKTAQENPKELAAFYDEKIKRRSEQAKKIEGMFEAAIAKEEFKVYYQPKVKLRRYRLIGAEALCRWQHDGKIIPPNDFIPILEQSTLICALDFYMLEHVCQDIRQWLDEGREVVRVSVNLSRRHMGDAKLLEKIVAVIDKYRVPHEYIEIELTETMTDVAFNDMKELVYGLHKYGIHTAVDDFGVGYSSLNLLRQIPWDVIKIDKSFLPDVMEKDSEQYAMLSHLLTMLKGMGFKCIVEGIETVEQVKMLKENNCYLAQGFYFDKPLPKEEFVKRLRISGVS